VLVDHLVREVGDGDPDVRAADVDPDDDARPAGEPHQAGGTPSGGAGVGRVGRRDQAAVDQVGDVPGHRRAGQPGLLDQLGPGGRAAQAQGLDQPARVARHVGQPRPGVHGGDG
jgi:hypothetical protein